MVQYGYRVDEVSLPAMPEIKESFVLSDPYVEDDRLRRVPVSVSAGCHLVGSKKPQPDLADTHSASVGVKRRAGGKTPIKSRKFKRSFRKFVRKYIRRNFVPLAGDGAEFPDFDRWLEERPYPDWRKQQLRDTYNNPPDYVKGDDGSLPDFWSDTEFEEGGAAKTSPGVVGDELLQRLRLPKGFRCNPFSKVKCFIKDEAYAEYKYPRGIYSRIDYYKCLVGPWFSLIEKRVFATKWFIKKIPVSDRPQYILDNLYEEGITYAATDYSSYEAHFDAELMEICEFQLYKYLTKNIPGHRNFWALLEYLQVMNKCIFKNFHFWIEATRMSGEMCTSLGNGFTNLMLMLYVLHKKGVNIDHVNGVVEGDDGLFSWHGPRLTTEDFFKCGFSLKMEYHDNLNTASFCGLIFDEKDKINITDPVAAMTEFSWLNRKYVRAKLKKHKELLRAKAYSMMYQFPGCPILSSLALYGLRVTEGHHARFSQLSMFHYERMMLEFQKWQDKRPDMTVPLRTRFLMEQVYGISVSEQEQIEAYLDNLEEIQPLTPPCMNYHIPDVYIENYNDYCRRVNVSDNNEVYYPTGFVVQSPNP